MTWTPPRMPAAIAARTDAVMAFFSSKKEPGWRDWHPYQGCTPEQLARIPKFLERLDRVFGPATPPTTSTPRGALPIHRRTAC